MELEELKSEVEKLLITKYDMTEDEAAEAIETSIGDRPDLWHENSDSGDLAKLLASDEDDD